ncbi:MAG: ABC transporter permease [Dehalococcoidia bacterium]|nr:ABC transporter permease [Dehalococcoidia bacterium]MDW8120023.1 ABC transporter permease [Chloroflexota bacterium]
MGTQQRTLATAELRWSGAARKSLRARLWAFVRRNPTMAAGIVVVLIMMLVAISAPLLATHRPQALNPIERLQPPSREHYFGTDHLGRDIYSRVIYGGRVSLVVGSSVALLAMFWGVVFGLIAGYFRRADAIIMRVMDGIMAFPALLLAIALVALLTASIQNVIIALTVVETPRATRVVRAAVLSLATRDFVEAARALGARAPRILLRHILPNTIAPLIVQGSFIFAAAVLTEASLSFLGAGTPPTIPSWGNIMGEGRQYVQRAVWVTFFPGVFLTITVLGINLIGDGLRDILDPRLARRL